jgi:hypothetical protein
MCITKHFTTTNSVAKLRKATKLALIKAEKENLLQRNGLRYQYHCRLKTDQSNIRLHT